MYNLSVISLNTGNVNNSVSLHWSDGKAKAKATANNLDSLEKLLKDPTAFFQAERKDGSSDTLRVEAKHIKIKGIFSEVECFRLAQIIDTFSQTNKCLKGEALVFKKCTLHDPLPLKILATSHSWTLMLREEKADAKM